MLVVFNHPIINSHFLYHLSTEVLDKLLDRVLEHQNCRIRTALLTRIILERMP